MKKAVLILLTITLFSCGDLSTEPDWSNYEPSLKSTIDYTECEGNFLLMDYIDSKMQEKNCY